MKKGFTLIETVVTIVVLSIIALMVMYIMTEGFRAWFFNRNVSELRQDGRFAIRRLAADFREAESVTLTSSTEVAFDSDLDRDGIPETITYRLDGSDMIRNESAVDIVMCSNIDSLNFGWSSPVLSLELSLLKAGDSVDLRTRIMARCVP